ncbi:1,6-dihydroxycyclohexa-2,4-diene-1-carboxylate dehydrogenase [Sphingomonas sp. Root710]|uniref:benzoate diol dehydrogenase BenD n=1 Tax=Sphingomonas sp. Root710 TaxID=1736594 RepID=UPI0006F50A23|nr:benzoate diol dehydrogenase BenD [Sphingomonas sp. Root710]KRB85310.1 1,6-dihydroxycyclohexa-2,4-diene-1-carboxylate dehydrogenase [Sphingomonas sp. Root710]
MSNAASIFGGRFAGKVMVVTGAAQGIGRGVALRAAAEGGRVLLADRADFVHAVATEADGEAVAFVCDLEKYDGAAAMVAEAVRRFGRIDILINNVGGAIRMRPFAEFAPEQIDAEIRRSLMPTLYACHAVLPVMQAQGGGTIVNVSSNATRGIHRVPYSAAKGGVNALTQSLAMEYAESLIRVVATAPGGTEAPARRIPRNPDGDDAREQGWMRDVVEQVTQSSFQKRYGNLDEQIAPILFLASDEASYITGSILPVAGGDLG